MDFIALSYMKKYCKFLRGKSRPLVSGQQGGFFVGMGQLFYIDFTQILHIF